MKKPRERLKCPEDRVTLHEANLGPYFPVSSGAEMQLFSKELSIVSLDEELLKGLA